MMQAPDTELMDSLGGDVFPHHVVILRNKFADFRCEDFEGKEFNVKKLIKECGGEEFFLKYATFCSSSKEFLKLLELIDYQSNAGRYLNKMGKPFYIFLRHVFLQQDVKAINYVLKPFGGGLIIPEDFLRVLILVVQHKDEAICLAIINGIEIHNIVRRDCELSDNGASLLFGCSSSSQKLKVLRALIAKSDLKYAAGICGIPVDAISQRVYGGKFFFLGDVRFLTYSKYFNSVFQAVTDDTIADFLIKVSEIDLVVPMTIINNNITDIAILDNISDVKKIFMILLQMTFGLCKDSAIFGGELASLRMLILGLYQHSNIHKDWLKAANVSEKYTQLATQFKSISASASLRDRCRAFDLFCKVLASPPFSSDETIGQLLEGEVGDVIRAAAQMADFDIELAVIKDNSDGAGPANA